MIRKRIPVIAAFTLIAVAVAGCASVDLQTKIDALQAELDKARQENILLKTQMSLMNPSPREERRAEQPDDRNPAEPIPLPESLKQEGVTAEKRGKDDVLLLPNKALFPSGVAALSAKGKSNLDEVIEIVKRDFPRASIRIEGHTDSDPIARTKNLYKSNWELSGARALSVLHYLTEKGIDPAQLSFMGYGEYRPLDPKSKAENRRVEIVLIRQ